MISDLAPPRPSQVQKDHDLGEFSLMISDLAPPRPSQVQKDLTDARETVSRFGAAAW